MINKDKGPFLAYIVNSSDNIEFSELITYCVNKVFTKCLFMLFQMEAIKLETDDTLDQKVDINELQSDRVIEQTSELTTQEELNCYDELFLTESNSESPQRIKGNSSSAPWEWTNGEFPSKFKEEVDDEDQYGDVLLKEESESVDIPDNKDIFDHNEMIAWSDDAKSCELSSILGTRYNEGEVRIDINEQSVSKMEYNAITKRKGQIVEQGCDRIEHVANCGGQMNVPDDNDQATDESNVCDVSDGRFDSETNAQVNIKIKSKILECLFCDYITIDKADYGNHGIAMHNQFLCSSCTFSTPLEFCFRRHASIKHPTVKQTPKEPKRHKCDKCSFAATSTELIEKHSCKVRVKKNKCELCDYRATSKSLVDTHRDAVHLKLKHFECHLCDFKAGTSRTLISHVDSVHLKRKLFRCQSCDYRTARSDVLKQHVDVVHLRMKNFKCEKCDFRTGTKYRLKLHAESVHSTDRYQCKLCCFRANLRYELKVHQRVEHSKLETFKCTTCEYRALTKLDLEIHVNAVHLKLKKYKCEWCDFGTCRKKCVKQHMNCVHLNRKQFKCNLCPYEADNRRDIKIHNDAVHFKLKNFKCDSCEFRTCRKSSLNWHAKHLCQETKKRECVFVNFGLE